MSETEGRLHVVEKRALDLRLKVLGLILGT